MSETTKKYFVIKKCEDVELVKQLHEQIFPADDWYDSPRSVMWVMWKGTEAIAFAMLSETNDDYVFYSRAGVKKDYRGHGIQLRLIRVREKYARSKGYKKAITYTKIDNITSNRNLQKAGYWLYIPVNEYADKDCLYWIKEL